MPKEKEILEAFDIEMRVQQAHLMAVLGKTQCLIDKTSGIDKDSVKERLNEIFTEKLTSLLEICDVEKG